MKRAQHSSTGMSSHRLNKIWRMMRQRCYNQNDQAYKNYGGKGVKVCEEWHTFKFFMEWALNNGYQDGLTIERKDSNGDYCPSNCEWITRAENCRRARKGKPGGRKGTGKVIEFNGESKTIQRWAEEIGIKDTTLHQRIANWGIEKALTTKPKPRYSGKLYTVNGVTKNLTEWAKELGVHPTTLKGRLQRGWEVEEALTTKNKWDKNN